MIAILDYGSGNIRSAQRAFERGNHEVVVTSNFEEALGADGLVIPGVGAFGACMSGLLGVRGDELIRERLAAGRKIFGICVGMQILFSQSAELYEGKSISGVGIFPQQVKKLVAPVLPHIGWNSLTDADKSETFSGVENEQFYFVHSYGVLDEVSNAKCVYSNYGSEFVAAIETKLITATQFHPEKSGPAGLRLIENWVNSL